MKIYYINILSFGLPLNIFESYQKTAYITSHTSNTKPIKPHRSLCECDINTPIYDNDPEMKDVMENFYRQTSQRFKEYDERIMKNRQKCKEQCDKDIQKIILNDKIEKELTEKLNILQTDITTKDIPTCVCKKSLADKMEKTCLKCTQNLGGIVAPSSGILGGISELAISVWKPKALAAAIAAAKKAGEAKGLAEGTKAGIDAVVLGLDSEFDVLTIGIKKLGLVFNAQNYNDVSMITKAICTKFQEWSCVKSSTGPNQTFCTSVARKLYTYGNDASTDEVIKKYVESVVSQAETVAGSNAEVATEKAIATLTDLKTGVVQTTYMGYQTVIIASIVAILVIVLVMVITYLILRYRRKKKMKKKLQYIKLLKE
ncbi:PIR protein, putative [Plasmodium sp.]|nr:PIR protein, putative [Plasmodium sp.]